MKKNITLIVASVVIFSLGMYLYPVLPNPAETERWHPLQNPQVLAAGSLSIMLFIIGWAMVAASEASVTTKDLISRMYMFALIIGMFW